MSDGAQTNGFAGSARRRARDRDQARTARLLLDADLAAATVAPGALESPSMRAATRVRGVPPRVWRVAEQVRYKLGSLDFDSGVMSPLLAARRAALGDVAAKPRFLIRVDEFPHYLAWQQQERFGTAAYERFHELFAAAGAPYLIAVLPRLARDPAAPEASGWRALEDHEIEMLARMAAEGVSFGLHGRDHRTRFSSPRKHSELCGLSTAQTEQLLDEALAELAPLGIAPDVFVPPFNRFDAAQFAALARRFLIVCGGPESIGTMGFHRTPQWRGEAVYLPSYAPVYGTAADVLPAVRHAIELGAGLWIPVVLHWGWEMDDDWRALRTLLECIAPYAASWESFKDAVRRSDR